MPHDFVIPATTLVAAPFIGSFIGTLIDRLPAGRPVVFARSCCNSCHRPIAVRDLIPIWSWLRLSGQCRSCKAPIGIFYPSIELAALTIAIWAVLATPGWIAAASAILGWALLALALIDWRHYLLPNSLVLFVAANGLATAALVPAARLIDHSIGMGLGYAVLAGLAFLYARLRGRDGLGGGDAKLFGALGAWVSWTGLPSVLLLASVFAFGAILVQKLRGTEIRPDTALPFGTFLAAGGWIVWLYGPVVLG